MNSDSDSSLPGEIHTIIRASSSPIDLYFPARSSDACEGNEEGCLHGSPVAVFQSLVQDRFAIGGYDYMRSEFLLFNR